MPGLRAGRGREGRVVLPNTKRLQRRKGEERILLAIIHSLNLESSLHYLGLAPLPGMMGGGRQGTSQSPGTHHPWGCDSPEGCSLLINKCLTCRFKLGSGSYASHHCSCLSAAPGHGANASPCPFSIAHSLPLRATMLGCH